ncbi:MAG: DEAD/DEAH box helicase, partial [Thermoanaerobaculia bacterium]
MRTRLEEWFAERGWTPFDFQREVWEACLAGESGLVHAPTGTGKTYAVWMAPLLEWMAAHPEPAGRPRRRAAAPPLRVLWITPLRALAADTEASLRAPLAGLGVPWT